MPRHGGLDQIAVISDVHGNVTALEAVLADIAARGITRILNLGDVVGKGPRSSEAVKLTRDTCEVTIRGNWDTFIARDSVQPFAGGQWTRDELTDDDIGWLAALPNVHDMVISGEHVRFFHASQVSEFHRVRFHHTEDEFRAMFTNTDFTGDGPLPTVVGYGDIHGAYLEVDLGLTLFNAGAVGNHLDAPTAPYVIIEGEIDGAAKAPISIGFVRVPYDIEAEIQVARDLGMPDAEVYGIELRDGIYRGDQTATG